MAGNWDHKYWDLLIINWFLFLTCVFSSLSSNLLFWYYLFLLSSWVKVTSSDWSLFPSHHYRVKLVDTEHIWMYFHQRYWPVYLFCSCVCIWICYQCDNSFKEEVWEFSFCFNFLNNLGRIEHRTSLKMW